jgi:hypothetical protein
LVRQMVGNRPPENTQRVKGVTNESKTNQTYNKLLYIIKLQTLRKPMKILT